MNTSSSPLFPLATGNSNGLIRASQVIKTSLIPIPPGGRGRAPAVTYCSALPRTQYDIPYPAFADYYTSFMASIAGQCSPGPRRADDIAAGTFTPKRGEGSKVCITVE